MDKNLIKQYLLDFKEVDLDRVRPREVAFSSSSKIRAVIGARRTGKTYLLYNKMKQLEKEGVSRDRIIYLNFENPVLDDISYKEFKKVIELHWYLFPESAQKKSFIFIDEPQVIPNWERAVRSLYDELNAEIYITGSSSGLLKKEMATALRGRSIRTLLLPLSFRESLQFKDIDYYPPFTSKKGALLAHHLKEFLQHGGYPEIVMEENKEERIKILKEYFDLTIYKDLIDRYQIQNTRLIKNLIDMVVVSNAKPFSINKHYLDLKARGLKLGKSTLYEYFDHLEDSLFLLPLKKFSRSQKTQDLSTLKIYLADTGFLNLYSLENFGQRLENMIFLELLRRTFDQPSEVINYWRSPSGQEIDFLVSQGGKPKQAIQVSYELNDQNTCDREIRSLVAGMNELGIKQGLILTLNESGEEERDGKTVTIKPAWEWLLDTENKK